MNDHDCFVGENKVQCNGAFDHNSDSQGHPNVVLIFKKHENEVRCPYCGRKFIREKD